VSPRAQLVNICMLTMTGRHRCMALAFRQPSNRYTVFVLFVSSVVMNKIEGICERTEHLDILLLSAHHSMVIYFRCSVYWWKVSVRF